MCTCRASIGMIKGKGETRKKRNDHATPPLCAFAMCTNNAMNNRVADFVLNSHIFHRRPILSVRVLTQDRGSRLCVRRDEKLVLDIYKMFGKLNSCTRVRRIRVRKRIDAHTFEVGVLDRVFDPVRCAERPGTRGATYL